MSKIIWAANIISSYRAPVYAKLSQACPEILFVVEQNADGRVDIPSDKYVSLINKVNITAKKVRLLGKNPTIPLELINIILKHKPKVLVSGELGFRTLICIVLKYIVKSRLVVHVDLSEFTEEKTNAYTNIVRKLMFLAIDSIIVNGQSGMAYVKRLLSTENFSKISIINYTSDIDYILSQEKVRTSGDELRFIYVGRLIQAKGIDLFIERLNKVLSSMNNTKIVLSLIGDGEYIEILKKISNQKNLTVKFMGYVPNEDLYKHLSDQDVFIMPTLGDTWGTVVNEAMAAALPVLGSIRSQAVQEMIIDGNNGWIFDPLKPETLDKAIKKCILDKKSYELMGEAARSASKKISPDHIAHQWLQKIRLDEEEYENSSSSQ